MRRTLLLILGWIGMSACTFGQAAAADTHTLQALLSEVRALRQDLRVSLNRAQSMQILLARFQVQEGAVTRAADRLSDARQKLMDTQIHQKELGLEQKRLEETPPATDPAEQSDLLDKINHVKADLEVTGRAAQQRQAAEIQAEPRLREEQDKLDAFENQLEELAGSIDSSNDKPGANRP